MMKKRKDAETKKSNQIKSNQINWFGTKYFTRIATGAGSLMFTRNVGKINKIILVKCSKQNVQDS